MGVRGNKPSTLTQDEAVELRVKIDKDFGALYQDIIAVHPRFRVRELLALARRTSEDRRSALTTGLVGRGDAGATVGDMKVKSPSVASPRRQGATVDVVSGAADHLMGFIEQMPPASH